MTVAQEEMMSALKESGGDRAFDKRDWSRRTAEVLVREGLASFEDLRPPGPPSRMVDLGDFRLVLVATLEGRPTR